MIEQQQEIKTRRGISASQWRQSKEKFQALASEIKKWATIRGDLGVLIDKLINSITGTYNRWSHDEDMKE